jgi:hypothetical protein
MRSAANGSRVGTLSIRRRAEAAALSSRHRGRKSQALQTYKLTCERTGTDGDRIRRNLPMEDASLE